MIGEWSHISAVGFSVDCLNIEKCYVRLRLRRNLLEGRISFLALQVENNDDTVHTWLSYLYSPNIHLRLCFLDFSKAFDRITLNVLIRKLIDLGVRRCLIPWIISFLSDP